MWSSVPSILPNSCSIISVAVRVPLRLCYVSVRIHKFPCFGQSRLRVIKPKQNCQPDGHAWDCSRRDRTMRWMIPDLILHSSPSSFSISCNRSKRTFDCWEDLQPWFPFWTYYRKEKWAIITQGYDVVFWKYERVKWFRCFLGVEFGRCSTSVEWHQRTGLIINSTRGRRLQ